MLADIFAAYIIKGEEQFSDVPNTIKAQVKERLEKLGAGHLAE